MVQYKLHYFNVKGRGEVLRLIFVAAGQEFQDNRIESANWPTLKAQAPLGKMPYLEINDGQKVIKIGQSMTIARYLAKKFNMNGKDEMDAVYADMYADEISDMTNSMAQALYEKHEERKKELMEKFMKETAPSHLKFIESRLVQNNGHLAGPELTYADLFLFAVLENMKEHRHMLLDSTPAIKKLEEEIRNHPKIKAYLEKRPKTAQ